MLIESTYLYAEWKPFFLLSRGRIFRVHLEKRSWTINSSGTVGKECPSSHPLSMALELYVVPVQCAILRDIVNGYEQTRLQRSAHMGVPVVLP